MPNEQGQYTQDDYNQMLKMQQMGLSPSYEDMPNEKSDSKLLEQMDPSKDLNSIENQLKSFFFDSQTKEWKMDDSTKKRITQEGVSEIMKSLRPRIMIGAVYSDIPEEIIINITCDASKEIGLYLRHNYKKFGMDIIDIMKIKFFCADMIYLNLRRAVEGNTLKMMRTMIQARELTTSQGNMKGVPGQEKKFSLNPLTWLGR